VEDFLFLYNNVVMNFWSHDIWNSSSEQSGSICSQKLACAFVRHGPAFESIFLFSPTTML